MARESPAGRIARLIAATAAWERLRPGRCYSGLTLAQFRHAIKPSHDTRAPSGAAERVEARSRWRFG